MNDEADKKPRIRSPEFPYISLREAIPRIEQLNGQYQRHAARVKNLGPVWNYSAGSSSLLRTVAALRAFGLLDETGSGEDRKVSISDLGMRILADKRPGVAEAALKKAFDNCTILGDYYKKWGKKRPPDHECISELTLDNGFSEVAAKKFISVYDDSVSYAEDVPSDSGDGGEINLGNRGGQKFDVGMFVQWEQAGDLKLPEAKKLTGFSADGSFAFVEGHATGIPRSELIAADAPAVNPRKNSSPPKADLGGTMVEATYPLDEGTCSLSFPKAMSLKSAKRLKRWLELMIDDVADVADVSPDNPEAKSES